MDSTDKLYHPSFSVAGHFIYVHQLQIRIHKVFSSKFGEHQVYTGTVVDPLYVTLLIDSYIFKYIFVRDFNIDWHTNKPT